MEECVEDNGYYSKDKGEKVIAADVINFLVELQVYYHSTNLNFLTAMKQPILLISMAIKSNYLAYCSQDTNYSKKKHN